MASNWSKLPNEICEIVLNRLCKICITCFKSVCKDWFLATQESSNLKLLKPVSPSPPWLTIPAYDDQVSSSCFYNVTNMKIHRTNTGSWRTPSIAEALCVGSSHGWLAFIDFRCVIFLVNPFTNATIRLPPIETLPDILSSSSPNADGSVYFQYWSVWKNYVEQRSSRDMFDGPEYCFLKKLVMSSSDPSSFQDITVMIIYGDNERLAVCRVGGNSWTHLDGELHSNDDLYYSDTNGKFHVCCDTDWIVEIWDFSDFSSPKRSYIDFPVVHGQMIEAAETYRRVPRMYLAELYGNLLVVRRYSGFVGNCKTFYFSVYKLDRMQKKWINIKSLGDNNGEGVLFLGINNAVTFSACDFVGLQPSSIYFTSEITGSDIGVFSLVDNSIGSLYHLGDFEDNLSSSVWISPNPW